jgi:hypothetical protein
MDWIEDYEQQLDLEKRKDKGIFYTPESVIHYILQKTVAQADVVQNPWLKILDPACGCGYFLIKAYDLLLNMFTGRLDELREKYAAADFLLPLGSSVRKVKGTVYWQPDNIPGHILTHCLFGADIDADAVKIAAANLLCKAMVEEQDLNLLVCDSLVKWENMDVEGEQEPIRQLWARRYDYVIGNPPYVSFGLRGVQTINSGRYRYLRKEYPNSAEYKLSLYALFFERGAELLLPGGKLAYITPDSFLFGKYYAKLRHYLASMAIISITLLEFSAFDDATIGSGVITVLSKREALGNTVNVATAVSTRDLETGCYAEHYQYDQQYLHPRFHLFLSQEELTVFDSLNACGSVLGDYCGVYSGCIAKYGQASIISAIPASSHSIYDQSGKLILCDDQAQGRWHKLLRRGANIGQYRKMPNGQYIYIHEDETVRKLYAKSGFDLKKYEGEKLLLRQTGGDLIAAYDDEGYFCLNNMHVIYSTNGSMPLTVVQALLNSYLYNFYYHCINRETKRVLPQIDIDILKQLPLMPVANTSYVSTLIDTLQYEYRHLQRTHQDEGRRKRIRECRNELEQYFLDLLGLDRHLQQTIMTYGEHRLLSK